MTTAGEGKLAGKRAMVTGANQGFGFHLARHFLAEGAQVTICARDAARLQEAERSLRQEAGGVVGGGAGRVWAFSADVSRESEVKRLVGDATRAMGGLDVLVCNAGVYGPKGPVEEGDWEAWRQAVSINIDGTVLPCREVLPLFKKQRAGRIVVLSGGGATKPMPFLSAYATSKAAVVRFAESLALEVKSYGIEVNSVAPGALNTRMLDEVLAAGPARVGQDFYDQMVKIKGQGGTAFDVGTSLCVFLASDESRGLTGKLLSAVWDPWKELPGRLADLQETDIYTLRRIVPRERGKDWG